MRLAERSRAVCVLLSRTASKEGLSVNFFSEGRGREGQSPGDELSQASICVAANRVLQKTTRNGNVKNKTTSTGCAMLGGSR